MRRVQRTKVDLGVSDRSNAERHCGKSSTRFSLKAKKMFVLGQGKEIKIRNIFGLCDTT